MDYNPSLTEMGESFTDVIKSMHKAMNNDNPDYYKIPDTRGEVAEYLEIFSGDDENFDGRPDDFESYVDPEYKTLLIFGKIWNYKCGS